MVAWWNIIDRIDLEQQGLYVCGEPLVLKTFGKTSNNNDTIA